MEPTDWAVSSVVFVSAVFVAILVAPTLLPEEPPELVESQLQDILASISGEIQVSSIILKSNCDPADYNCDRQYPVEFDINESRYNMFSDSFTEDSNKIYGMMRPGSINKVYTMPRQRLEPSYNTSAYTLDSDTSTQSGGGGSGYIGFINVHNQYIDANISDTNASIDFLDSNEKDLAISYPRMEMARLVSSEVAVVVGNDRNKFFFRFFPNSAEFWIDVPDDINIQVRPMHLNYNVDENVNVMNFDAWWDNDATDAYIWHYRVPITVHALDYYYQDQIAQADINFELQKIKLGRPNAVVEFDSFRLIEYANYSAYDSTTSTASDSLALNNQPFHVYYSSSTDQATLTWKLYGTTYPDTVRHYYLYFDFTDYPKPYYAYNTLDYTVPSNPPYVTVADAQAQNQTKVFDTNQTILYNPNTILITTVNQLSRVWEENTINYRKPLLFDSGKYARSSMHVSADVNFIAEFNNAGCGGCDLDLASLIFAEVNNWDEGAVLMNFTHSDSNLPNTYNHTYNAATKMMNVSWFVPSTPALVKRHYFLYYNNSG